MKHDVCLLLEGTFPYVAGGVSTWVYDLIRSMPQTSFAVVFIGAQRSEKKQRHYEIPPNVREFQELYLFDYRVRKEKTRPRPGDFEKIYEFMRGMECGETAFFDEILEIFGGPWPQRLSLYDLVHSKKGWKVLQRLYHNEQDAVSFIDYFWTWRFLYTPFYAILRARLPEALVYHTASTGYAGVLGAIAKKRTGRPLLLTEHGIYTRERKIEIAKADWIYSDLLQDIKVSSKRDFFKEWWISLFSYFSKLVYERADRIYTLYEGNRLIQQEEGADPAKIEIIPNGIDSPLDPDPPAKHAEKLRIGFAGRVVPIKDVKTLIRAFKLVKLELPETELYIMGPTDEDALYYRECCLLVENEGLGSDAHFMGKVKLSDYYPTLDVLVLTSISEGQPLVMLEAAACGIPVVATQVGSCRELLYGKSADDQLIGTSGRVTPICDPAATANTLLKVLKNPVERQRMGLAAKERVKTYYQLEDVLAAYEQAYAEYGDKPSWPV